MKSFASLVSFIGNPLTVGLFFGIYVYVDNREPESLRGLPLLFSLIIILPLVLFISFNVLRKRYANFDVSNQNRRKEVYLLLIVLFAILSAIIYLGDYNIKALVLSLGLFFYIFISYLVNQKVKASMHTGVCFLFSWIFYPLSPFISIGLFLFGFLNGWSRLQLGRHTFQEVLYGLILGNVIGFFYLVSFNYFV